MACGTVGSLARGSVTGGELVVHSVEGRAGTGCAPALGGDGAPNGGALHFCAEVGECGLCVADESLPQIASWVPAAVRTLATPSQDGAALFERGDLR